MHSLNNWFLATLREAMRFSALEPPYHPRQNGSDMVLENNKTLHCSLFMF